jgi:hypothetical protein
MAKVLLSGDDLSWDEDDEKAFLETIAEETDDLTPEQKQTEYKRLEQSCAEARQYRLAHGARKIAEYRARKSAKPAPSPPERPRAAKAIRGRKTN